MRKVGHKIILLLTVSVLLSSLGGSWLALKGFTESKEDELLEKNAQVVLAVANLVHLSKRIDTPELTQAISSYPLFGVGIIDLSTGRVLLSNGGLSLSPEEWMSIKNKTSSAAVSSLTLKMNFLSVAYLDKTSLAVIATTPRTSVWHLVRGVFKSYMIFLLILTIILGFIGSLVAKAMMKPIEELTHATELLAQGEWDLKLSLNRKDEIGILSKAFWRLGHSLKERESTIKKMHEELVLSEKLAMVGQFSSGIAHEIKNPLASISTHLQLLHRYTKNPQDDLPIKVMEKTEIVLKEVDRANRIITDILGFARQEKLNTIKVNLCDYLANTIKELRPLAEARNASLTVNLPETEILCDIDQDRIRQVLSNLLSNSLDALNGKEGTITWTASVDSDVKIKIEDNGPGIPESHRNKLFDPFFTSKPTGKGTGLGLSVCHGIIKQHGGNLSLYPASVGATFLITLPLGA